MSTAEKYKTNQNVGWFRAYQKINLVSQMKILVYYYGRGDTQENIMN